MSVSDFAASPPKTTPEPLAIVGIGCRFPGQVTDPQSFWKFLTEGRSGIVEVPPDRWCLERFYHENPAVPGRMNTRYGGFVDHVDRFDARFWGITPREAMRMDPQQRWLLEVAWEAIEDSGTPPSRLGGQRVGVFVGIATHDYSGIQGQTFKETDAHTNSGSTLSIASNRISYLLNLKGPSLSVDTACSSSLVALSIACRSIWAGECDAALTGGVNLMCAPHATVGFAKASMLSPDGQCFAFDERANGYVRGEGAGVVYFKKLKQAIADGDSIYAVIRAAVMNQDGHTSSMTVPGAEAQATMLRRAYQEAGLSPRRVVYMEAHGTGTPVGDPIEASALGRVLSEGREDHERCLIGSVKSNIGHLEAGSGIAGLIKAALVLHHGMIPPNANFRKPSPYIPFDDLKLEVVDRLRELPRQNGYLPVTAVNSFGFGGTNSHAVLEAAPVIVPVAPKKKATPAPQSMDRPFLLPVSARDPQALRAYAKLYADSLDAISAKDQDSKSATADFCASAGGCKEHHDERLVIAGRTAEELRSRLIAWGDPERQEEVPMVWSGRSNADVASPVFVFTGQGAQWWGMGQELFRKEPLFKSVLEDIDQRLSKFADYSLLQEMNRTETTSRIHETHIAQPAMFALQVALTELWQSWGIRPSKVVGHSVGEVAAAYAAGVYSLDDAIKIIFHRSRLQHTTAGQGKMLAVGLSSREARRLIGEHSAKVQIAAINSSNLVTLAGDELPLQELARRLEANQTFLRWLPVDYPFHTHLMDPIHDELLDVLADIQPKSGHTPFISTVTGGVFQSEKMDATYWWSNVRNPVLFAPAINNLVREGEDTFLEVGPHPALKGSVNECLTDQGRKGVVFHSLRRQEEESKELLINLAAMEIYGVPGLDWNAINQSSGKYLRLPSYPWSRERYWLEDPDAARFRLDDNVHPLLGMRITGSHPTFEFDLDPRVYTYLESHRFWGTILFPAAGYGEIALALARAVFPSEAYTVEDLLVKKALFINENDVPTVRVEFYPVDKTFTISSSTGAKEDWELHVQGRLTLLTAEVPPRCDLAAIKARLPNHISHQDYYVALDAAGYHFGPHFKLIKNVYHTLGEALIEVPLPVGEIAPEPGHHFHPILLDACLQVGKAAIDAPEGSPALRELFLPRKLGRIRFYRKEVPARFWAHGIQRLHADDHLVFDIYVYDDQGDRVCDILGFKTEMMEHIRDGNDVENCLYRYQWEPSEILPDAKEQVPVGGTTLVFLDAKGVTEKLIPGLKAREQRVVQISAGEAFQETGENRFVVAPDSEHDLARILEKYDDIKSVLHGWSLDHPDAKTLHDKSLGDSQKTGVLSALLLTHLLAPRGDVTIFCLTCDAQLVTADDKLSRPESSSLIGMARVAFNEHPNLSWRMIDLPAKDKDIKPSLLLAELEMADREHAVAYRGGQRYVQRLVRVRAADLPRHLQEAVQADGSVLPYQLQIETPGILSNLSLNLTERREPGPDDVEAKVVAAGINFRNVMKALGMPIGNTELFSGFGEDFAGTILRVGKNVKHLKPGDEVVGLGAYSFRSYVTTHGQGLFLKPKHLSFADAATIPTVFLTANFAMRRLANLQRGEKILIHAGTGGVGQAAIQIAHDMGLEVFATAGSKDKQQLLHDLGVQHVMNSRTLDFVDDIRRITDGYGVDAVLNSLAGDFIPKSLSVLAPFGRFVEIGKVDIYNNSQIGMELLRNNISYFVFDLIEYIVHKTPQVAEMFEELRQKFDSGVYKPLTHNDFPITKVEEAYRYMAQGKHVGKNVLTFDLPSIPIGTRTEDGGLFRKDGTYLVTGGASGFGLEVAKWMSNQGAGHLVLMSRSGPADDAARKTIAEIENSGTKVTDARGDVTKLADVQRVVKASHADPKFPLRGVIHGAMVIHDEFLAALDEASFQKVLRPKMDGAWNLHVATLKLPLDHFICFSSFSAVIGAPKQGNYNAGNVFLDALAHHRHAAGLPALTVNWGAISGAGFVARNEKTAQYLDAIGMRAISVDECIKVLRRMLQHEAPQILASRADWNLWRKAIPLVGHSPTFAAVTHEQGEDAVGGSIGPRILAASADERPAMVENFIAENLAAVCSIDADGIDFDTPLTSLGLDSLMAVELMNRIEGDLGLSIPMGKVLSGPTIRQLAAMILQSLTGAGDGEGGAEGSSESTAAVLKPIESQGRLREYPISERQRSLWNHAVSHPDSIDHVVSFLAAVSPAISPEILARAIAWVEQRHPQVQAIFAQFGGVTIQRRMGHINVTSHSIQDKSAAEQQKTIERWGRTPFKLEVGPNVRIGIFQTATNDQVIYLQYPEIIADRRSAGIIIDSMLAACDILSRGEALPTEKDPLAFHDFVSWEQNLLKSDSSRKRLDYWRQQWVGAPAQLLLPVKANPLNGASTGTSFKFELAPELSQRLLALAAEQQTSLKTLMFSAYQLWLHQVCGQGDFILGTTISGRQHTELQGMVGQFENPVGIRCTISDDPTFVEVLAKAGEKLDDAQAFQYFPLSLLQHRLQVTNAEHSKPRIEAAFEMPQESTLDARGFPVFLLALRGHKCLHGDRQFASMDGEGVRAGAPLTLHIAEAGGCIFGCWKLEAGLIPNGKISGWHESFLGLLTAIAENPMAQISELGSRNRMAVSADDWIVPEAVPAIQVRTMARPEDAELPIDPVRESLLDPAIVIPADKTIDFKKWDQVLLTGGTGFVGAHLVDNLLKKTKARLVCVVRADSEEEGLQRIARNMQKYGLELGSRADRLRIVLGDLTQPLLGMTPRQFQDLARETDVVYHNGADINLTLDYSSLRAVNVFGTHEVLRFAFAERLKPTHVVSSYAVHASRDCELGKKITEETPLPRFDSLANGYSKTKWVTERMIERARALGLPVSIYRPGNITGHSISGASNTGDIMHTLVMAILHVGAIPDVELTVDLTPVDFVADSIVALSQKRECQGGTFNLLNPTPLHVSSMASWLRGSEFHVDVVPMREWREGLANLVDSIPGEVMGVMAEVLSPDANSGLESDAIPAAFQTRFDCSRVTQALQGTGVQCHPVDDLLLSRYLAFLEGVGFFDLFRSGATA
jgi:thioester reductase-like protein